mgnify:CR=1 FL=1|tara:strand:+ start:912 stop:1391 length:480 start_codon:yes stop_codon:yes gene_type:complete
MSSIEVRPRFHFELKLSEDEAKDRIRKLLKFNNALGFKGQLKNDYLLLKCHTKKHFWTPQMEVRVEKEDDVTLVKCLITPEPSIWTFFMFSYVVSGFGLVIGLMIGSSQITLEKDVWGFWLAGISLIVGLLFYFIALTGKRLAYDERKAFFDFIRQVEK